MSQQTEPHFFIETLLLQSPQTDLYDEEEMRVHNAGSPVYNLAIDVDTFIVVRRFGEKADKTFVAIVGYFSVQFNHHNPQGHLATLRGHKNNYHVARLDFASREDDVVAGYGYFELGVLAVARISCETRLGEKGSAYFWGREQVDGARLEALPSFDDVFPKEFETITPDSLMQKVDEINSEG